MCAFCDRFSFFSAMPRDWLRRMSPKWPILCRDGRKTLTQSISQSKVCHYVLAHNLAKCWSIFKTFAVGLYSKFVIKSSLKVPRHVKHIAALHWEMLLSSIVHLLLLARNSGTVFLSTSSLPCHPQHFVRNWKLIYFYNHIQTLFFNCFAIVVLEVSFTWATLNSV